MVLNWWALVDINAEWLILEHIASFLPICEIFNLLLKLDACDFIDCLVQSQYRRKKLAMCRVHSHVDTPVYVEKS